MINKTISIPYELSQKLKQEENASALITRLLLDYYKFSSTDLRDIEEQIETIKLKDKENTATIKTDLERLQDTRKKIIVENKQREKIIKKNKSEEEELKKTFVKTWKKETGKTPKEKQFIKFKEEWDNPKTKTNIYTFIKENAKP